MNNEIRKKIDILASELNTELHLQYFYISPRPNPRPPILNPREQFMLWSEDYQPVWVFSIEEILQTHPNQFIKLWTTQYEEDPLPPPGKHHEQRT